MADDDFSSSGATPSHPCFLSFRFQPSPRSGPP